MVGGAGGGMRGRRGCGRGDDAASGKPIGKGGIMRIVTSALAVLLIGAAPGAVPVGKFQTWLSFKKASIDFVSGGVRVHVEALPCPARPIGDSSCAWEGYNNQGAVTVSASGAVPLTVTTDRQSAYARIAVVRFQRHDPRPGVIVESQYGGSGGVLTVQLIVPTDTGFRAVPIERRDGAYLEGQIDDFPRDVSGDGRIDLKLQDSAFDSVFGCNGCTPRPPMLFTLKDGTVIDESRDPALRGVFVRDMARLAPICLSGKRYRNGACAAYVADAARAGRFRSAWGEMLKHYERGGDLWQACDVPVSAWTDHRCPDGHGTHFTNFPDSLRAFLVRTGYLFEPVG